MIQFIECPYIGYAARTRQNVRESDVTIAFAVDFKSPGEICTRNACKALNKPYIDIYLRDIICPEDIVHMGAIANIYRLLVALNPGEEAKLDVNIAGNGIYTLKDRGQEFIDNTIAFVLQFLKEKIKTVRSGGQSGVDEAALKAAERLGIPAICLAPKGWIYRDINGKDIKGEQSFKSRF